MIGNLTYEEMDMVIKMLETANNNLKKIIQYYKNKVEAGTMKIERFNMELENYITYLKNNSKINKDADFALSRIKELNS